MEAYQKDTRTAGRKSLAWKMARIASNILKEKYGAKKVVLFGSLANEKRFTPWSDIDLSVSGLSAYKTIIRPPGKSWILDWRKV